MPEILRKTLDLIGTRRRRFYLLAVSACVVAGIDASAAVLVFALLHMLTTPDAGLEVPVLGDLGRFAPGLDPSRLLLAGGLVVTAFFVVRAVAYLGHIYLLSRVSQNTGAALSTRLVTGYLQAPYAFHLRHNSAELVRNSFDSVQRLTTELFGPAIRVMSEIFVILAILAVLVTTAPLATGLTVLVFGPAVWLLLRVLNPWLKRAGRTAQHAARSTLQSLQQSLAGIRDIKVFGRVGFFVQQFAQERRTLARMRYQRDVVLEVPRVTMETVLVLFVGSFLAVSVLTDRAPQEAIAVLGLFGYAAFRALPGLTRVIRDLNAVRFAAPTVDDVCADLRLLDRFGLPDHSLGRLAFRHELACDDVSYRYEGAARDALSDISIRLPRGGSLGIVGPTGGGKTTLVDVLTGLLEPSGGTVTVDGVDVQTNIRGWQDLLGIVPQALFLLDDSLRRNIAFGVRDEETDERRVQHAVRLAQLEDFVAELPEGLDTFVGERGIRLSGGQRQRVAIARALYFEPEVLIFDEATSALDRITERDLMDHIGRLAGERTMIIVAHRISTVRHCDEIVIVAGGHITDRGRYDELFERNVAFRELAG